MNDSPTSFEPASTRSKVIAGILGLIVLVVAFMAASYMIRNKPKATRRPPMAQTPVVDVRPLVLTNHLVRIDAMGLIIPAREVSLQAEVTGRILSIHPNLKKGGIIKKDEVLVQLDSRSHEAILLQHKAALETARSHAELEKGQQTVAQADLDLMKHVVEGVEMNPDLALRKPQLKAAQAAVDSAQAMVEQAALSVERTRITAPWDAVVLSANAEVGGQATAGSVLARLIGTQTFWIQVSLPVAQLPWVQFPDANGNGASRVTISTDNGASRAGTVLRQLPDLDTTARMARLLVAIEDPLGLQQKHDRQPLLLNDYVSVQIEGSTLSSIYAIPRAALRDGDNIWLMDQDHRFHIHPVNVIWGTEDRVIIDDSIGNEQQLIVSALAAPVENMELRTATDIRKQAVNKKPSKEE